MKQKDQVDLKYSEIADAKNAILDFWPAGGFLEIGIGLGTKFFIVDFFSRGEKARLFEHVTVCNSFAIHILAVSILCGKVKERPLQSTCV